jgi:predicted RNase H-like nuclease
LSAKPFAAAVAESVRQSGTGISQQAYALRTKILEVEEWLPTSTSPVWEVHPEVSFAVDGGAMLTDYRYLAAKLAAVLAEPRGD